MLIKASPRGPIQYSTFNSVSRISPGYSRYRHSSTFVQCHLWFIIPSIFWTLSQHGCFDYIPNTTEIFNVLCVTHPYVKWCARLKYEPNPNARHGIKTLRSRRDAPAHFPENISKCNFLKENVYILIRISLKFVPKGPIINNPALVYIMAWRRPCDKPLSEPMMVSLSTHICVTRAQ